MSKVVEIKNRWTATELIELSEELEQSTYTTVRAWMIHRWSFCWDDNPALVELYEYLKATMYFDVVLGCWLDK